MLTAQGRRARRGARAGHRRRRLPVQAVLVRRAARPAARPAAPWPGGAAGRLAVGDLRLDPAAHGCWRGDDRDRAHPAAVLAARVPHAPSRRGPLEARDPRARLGLRVRRRPEHRRGLRRPAAPPDRRAVRPGEPRRRSVGSATGSTPTAADMSRRMPRGAGTGPDDARPPPRGGAGARGRRLGPAAHPARARSTHSQDDSARSRAAGRGRRWWPRAALPRVAGADATTTRSSRSSDARRAGRSATSNVRGRRGRLLVPARRRRAGGADRHRRPRRRGPRTTASGPIRAPPATAPRPSTSPPASSRSRTRSPRCAACCWSGVPLMTALLGVVTWTVVGRALRPVESIRAEVADISESTSPAGARAARRRRDRPAGPDDERDARPARSGQPTAARVRRRRLARAAEPAHPAAHTPRGGDVASGDDRLGGPGGRPAGRTAPRWSGWSATCCSSPETTSSRTSESRTTSSTSTTWCSRRWRGSGSAAGCRSTQRGVRRADPGQSGGAGPAGAQPAGERRAARPVPG